MRTRPSGSSFLVLVSSFSSNASAPIDSYGNTWTPLGPAVVYDGYQGRFDVRAYVSLDGRGGPHHTVSVTKKGVPAGEITVPFVEIRDASVLQDVARSYPALTLLQRGVAKVRRTLHRWAPGSVSADGHATSGEVTTTGPATLIAVWWGDANIHHMEAIPGNGFTVIDRFVQLPPESGVQCVVAYRQVDAAGTYHVDWTTRPAQRAILWLFAFQGGS